MERFAFKIVGLFLIFLVGGAIFFAASLYVLDHFFCPLLGGKACEGLGEIAGLMLHISHLKIILLSLLPLFFSAIVFIITYSLLEKRLDTNSVAWVSLRIADKARRESPLRFERWLALHINSPTSHR